MNLIIIAAMIAATFIPETNERTLETSPLGKGSVAYVANASNETCSIVIGGSQGKHYSVVDSTTIHGYQVKTLKRSEFSVIKSDGLTYNGVEDSWTLVNQVNVTNTLYIYCQSGVKIGRIEYETADSGYDPMSPHQKYYIEEEISENMVTLKIWNNRTGTLKISNLKVYLCPIGNSEYVNDVRAGGLQFNILDSVGSIELGNMRQWLLNYYNGNRGEDWASYDANHTIHLQGQDLYFSKLNRFSIRCDGETNVSFYAAGHKAVTFEATGSGEGYEGCFIVTDFERGTNGYDYIEFSHDIDGFNLQQVGVDYASNYTGTWHAATISINQSENKIIVTNPTGNQLFYRLRYNGTITDIYAVTVRAPLKIENDLYLRGTDNVLYKITVTGGVISATAVN